MLLTVALILVFVVLVASLFRKLNIPLILIALAIGIVFGSDVTGLIYLDDAVLVRDVANIALIFILFAGGFGTKKENLRPVFRPVILLATVGVLLTAGITAVGFHWLGGWSLGRSLLLSIVISSTDAAAVFSILRSRSLKTEAAAIAEIESAANDPMAIVGTTFVIQTLVGGGISVSASLLGLAWRMSAGVALGVLFGMLAAAGFNRIRSIELGYHYIYLIGIILLTFSLAEAAHASGMLAVFFAGVVMGNRRLPLKGGIASFTTGLSFIANVGLFILLGLLVFPRQFARIWLPGMLVFLVITFVGRPLTVFLCTWLEKYSLREKAFLSWSGVRGSVPIVLATYPAAAGLDPGHEIFNIVFFAVVLSVLVQGTTIGKAAALLKLGVKAARGPRSAMELVTIVDTDYELVEISIDRGLYAGTCRIADLSLPPGVTITMINREDAVIAPAGATVVQPGDVLSVLVEGERVEETTRRVLAGFRPREE